MTFKPFDPNMGGRARGTIYGDRRNGETTRMLLAALLPVAEHRTVILMAETRKYADTLRGQLLRMAAALRLTVDYRRVRAVTSREWFDEPGNAMLGQSWTEDTLRIFVDHTAGGANTEEQAYRHAVRVGVLWVRDGSVDQFIANVRREQRRLTW